ncbi:MAG: SapC family protein [Chlorobiaceae bacterium]
METQNLPVFYRNPVPLNKETHASLTVGPSPEGYRFAASARTVLLAAVEFFDAGRQFPIIFSATPDGKILPVALMGLEENENLFIDAKGTWLAQYIPAYIRRYPFITTDGSEGQTTVCIDQDFDGFNRKGGVPLFKKGEPTAKTQEIQAFLQDYLLQVNQTELFGAMLLQNGLLRQIDAQANMNDGHTYPLNGMLVVDEQKLADLPDFEVVSLFRSGALAQIHAHLLSLRNLDVLIERKSKKTE